jgi:hypothetical protein
MQDEFDAVQRVQSALESAGVDGISFTAEVFPTGKTALHLLGSSPAVEPGIGPHPGALILVEGSVPEPWRRLPDPVPGAVPAPSADLVLLEQTLRERLPDAIGATESEIAAAEARLGVTLPDELKVLYRVTRARWEDWGDADSARSPALAYSGVPAKRERREPGCALVDLFPYPGILVAHASFQVPGGNGDKERL